MIEKGKFINNRYEILCRVGAGGMSDVYKAKDHKLNRNVAIKVLKREYSKDTNFVSKFRVEAQSAASLIHPNIVNVYDVGQDDGLYYIVMELIEGITLKKYIEKKKRLSVKETISIAIQIANGIECAHNNQIVHRDIKPQNIMISREGKVKVTDFGIARAASANTLSGNAMGSVHYISPEQAGGKYVDEKSDIYSLGITMFEMLTGVVPFDGESTVTIALKHIQSNVPSVKEYIPNIPISIEKIILKCTQNKADKRYPKISLLIADLKRALSEPYIDFVQLDSSEVGGSTIMITDDEINKIRKESGDFETESEKDDSTDDIDVVSPGVDKVLTIGGVVVGIIALVIVAVLVTLFVIGNTFELPGNDSKASKEVETLDPRKTTVPNVVGMSADEAQNVLQDSNLGIGYDMENGYEYSELYPADYIISQSEPKGTIVDRNSKINVVVSKGPERIQLPAEIVGSDLSKIVEELEELGLKWEVTYEYSSKDVDEIISCIPNEKAAVKKDDIVKLTVSRGEQSSGENVAKVPSVEQMKWNKAEEKIHGAGFEIGEVRFEYSDEVEKDKVIRQTIKSGSTAPKGASIGLIVSLGAETPTDATIYTASYTFAKDDLYYEDGSPITTGSVSVLLNGVAQPIDPSYVSLELWPDDYTINLTGTTAGNATIELYIDGVAVMSDTVKLK